MLDRPCNSPDNVFMPLALQAGQGMLCLAPHPDDEVLGCAGLLVLAQGQGLRVKAIIVTSGEEGGDGGRRLGESREAARELALPEPECWGLADRELRHSPALIERVAQALRDFEPSWLLLPALTEPHPDHQALALAGMAAAQRQGGVNVLFYEVGSPTQVNTIVDISAVAERKWRALDAFASQQARHDYKRHARAMAELRAFVAGEGVAAAEAFWQIPALALARGELGAALGGWPLQRAAAGLASAPQQLPLVSVIVRSMDRPTLGDAIASVAAQTYPNIEIIIVNASGAEHSAPAYPPDRLRLTVVAERGQAVQSGRQPRRLDRSAAANLGLRSMAGDYGLFLDDDDVLGPEHLQRLVQALQAQATAAAAYAGVRVEGPGGQWIRDYDMPWDARRLRGINFLPIHSVLFRRETVQDGQQLYFDEALPVLEDWDFWCQLSRRGAFVHVPGIASLYRQGLGDSHVGDAGHEHFWARWHQKILLKQAQQWGLEDQSATLAWHAVALDQAETRGERLQLELATARQQLADTSAQAQQQEQTLRARAQQLQGELDRAKGQSQVLGGEKMALERQWLQAEAERALSQRSLDMLQQSLPVRLSRALRKIFRKTSE